MLVLARKESQKIRIADDIEIVVLAVQGRKVRLGINCPHDIPVHRSEIQNQDRRRPTPTTLLATNHLTDTTPRDDCLLGTKVVSP